MKHYAMYLRKSRAEQNQSLEDTLRKHKETLIEYADNNNITISDTYEEVVSGESLYSRPQMLKLLEAVGNNTYSGVLCMDIDRLGRGGMSDQGVIIETLKKHNTLIITPQRIYNLNDEIDENNIEFAAFFARFEYKQIKKRMLAGSRKSAKEGGYVGLAPYGYRNTTVNKRPTLEIYEPEAKAVRTIFDLYTNKKMGSQYIAEALNYMGFKPHRADKFSKITVLRILKNPAYAGKIVWRKKESIEKQIRADALHQPIIDIDLWDRTQIILNTNYRPPAYTGDIKNSLSGLVYCSNCGHLMKRASPNKSRKTQSANFLCSQKGCITSSRYEYIEKALIYSLEEELKNLNAKLKQDSNKNKYNYSSEIDAIEVKIKEINNQKDQLHDLLEQGIYDVNTFLERQKALTDRINKINNHLEKLQALQDKSRNANIKQMQTNIKNVLELYWQSEPSERNELLKSIIDKAIYFKKKGANPADFKISLQLKQVYF